MKTVRTFILFLILSIPVLGLAAQPAAIGDKLSALLISVDADVEIPVIATLAERVNPGQFKGLEKAAARSALIKALQDKAATSQGELVRFLHQNNGRNIRSLWIINAVAVTLKPQAVYALANNPAIASINYDDMLAAPVKQQAGTAIAEWNLNLINAPVIWSEGFFGAGAVVANMDTGVDYLHPDLAATWRGGTNSWYDPNGEHAAPYDANGHGTQTMGVMVAGSGGGTAVGVAPDASWIAVKIYNDAGDAAYSAIHAGFQWLLDPDGDPSTDDAPDVVNGSWGLRNAVNICVSEFSTDVQILKAADIGVIFSAGNEGPGLETSVSPANYVDSLAVGSIDNSLVVAQTSSRGPSACDASIYPELIAPGEGVRTTDLTFGGIFPDSYTTGYGTSFAATHVSAGLALLHSIYPQLSMTELEQALKDSALDLGQYGPDNDYGYGLIDLEQAYLTLQNPGGCTDADSDGFFAEPSCGTPVDCDDRDATINPAACDIKGDGIDQDCDGIDRTKGKDCPLDSSTGGGSGGGGSGGGKGKGGKG